MSAASERASKRASEQAHRRAHEQANEAAIEGAVLARMLEAARAARQHAYAPYSRFAVGAALLDEHGRIHAGCNVENAAYPQGVCAEAGALSALVLAGGRVVRAVLVLGQSQTAADAPSTPVTPCGGCRQKLREFAADDTPVLTFDMSFHHQRYTLGELLPASFGPQHLAASQPAEKSQP